MIQIIKWIKHHSLEIFGGFLILILTAMILIGIFALGLCLMKLNEYGMDYKVTTYTDKDTEQEYLIIKTDDGVAITPRLK